MKKNNKMLIITCILCLIPIVAGLVFWKQLPDKIVTHFDSNNLPNQYSNKLTGIILIPLICCFANVIVGFSVRFDPRNKKQNSKVLTMILWLLPIIGNYVQLLIITYALGYHVNMIKMVWFLLGFIFMIIGNYFPKMQPNYTLGIRIPWTLRSDDNWRRTHRFFGFLWTVGGFIIITTSFFLPVGHNEIMVWLLISIIFLFIAIPITYSWLLARNKANRIN